MNESNACPVWRGNHMRRLTQRSRLSMTGKNAAMWTKVLGTQTTDRMLEMPEECGPVRPLCSSFGGDNSLLHHTNNPNDEENICGQWKKKKKKSPSSRVSAACVTAIMITFAVRSGNKQKKPEIIHSHKNPWHSANNSCADSFSADRK